MSLEESLREEVARFVRESPLNRQRDGQGPYFDAPLVGFAAVSDPLFQEYKTIIGEFHWTPREALEAAHVPDTFPRGTVVSWVLPVTRETRASNRAEGAFPSRRWAHTRDSGERFNDALRRHVVEFLGQHGHRAAAPALLPGWRTVRDSPVGLASVWSERHAAYAAGLGTFSLNDGLITPRGIAHRLGSVVTDAVVPPSERPDRDYRANCLTCRGDECGACIGRCPAGAISAAGHDKERCRQYSYEVVLEKLGREYEVEVTGCGLCQTGVPCESRIPRPRTAR